MSRLRSILSLILVVVATAVVSWVNPSVAIAATTYSPAQVQQIQQYIPDLTALRDRMNELPPLFKNREWTEVSQFIHGPLAEMRLKMTYITRNLTSKDQPAARQVTRDLFTHLVNIDKAAQQGNYQRSVSNYKAALADIDNFLNLVPAG